MHWPISGPQSPLYSAIILRRCPEFEWNLVIPSSQGVLNAIRGDKKTMVIYLDVWKGTEFTRWLMKVCKKVSPIHKALLLLHWNLLGTVDWEFVVIRPTLVLILALSFASYLTMAKSLSPIYILKPENKTILLLTHRRVQDDCGSAWSQPKVVSQQTCLPTPTQCYGEALPAEP